MPACVSGPGEARIAFERNMDRPGRDDDESLDRAIESQKLMPSFWGMIVQGWAEGGKGTHAAAVESMREAVALTPGLAFADAALAQALARNGERKEAQEILARLPSRVNDAYVSAYDVALVLANLGDGDSAFEWLAKSSVVAVPNVDMRRIPAAGGAAEAIDRKRVGPSAFRISPDGRSIGGGVSDFGGEVWVMSPPKLSSAVKASDRHR